MDGSNVAMSSLQDVLEHLCNKQMSDPASIAEMSHSISAQSSG